MLMRGLLACKRKGKAPGESSKRAWVNIPIPTIPVSYMGAPEIAPKIEVPPAFELGLAAEAVDPPMPLSPPVETHTLEPPLERKKEVGKKRTRRALRKSQWKVHLNGPNRSLNRLRLELEKAHEDHQVEVEHLIKKCDEIDCSLKGKTVEVEVLRKALCKEKEALEELRTALGTEEKWRRRAEVETAELKEQISR
ncbi:hypothetical protein COCNU_01G015800 [Cocos nucifera]|uniref:Uncharacterized protein n=1 Tax=Cocos nucifera TaxID=13894 RepID=A0A8K0HW23_COCNU|nr:hypothetical protein COCNU_01G015800 [Cocos nucifera]